MIIDRLLSTAKVALTGLNTSTQVTLNSPVLDFGVPANQGLMAASDGPGFVITIKGGTSGEASTLTLRLVTDDNVGLATPTVLETIGPIALADTVDNQIIVPIPATDAWERFAAWQAIAGTAVFTGGTVEVNYVANIRQWRAYPAQGNT